MAINLAALAGLDQNPGFLAMGPRRRNLTSTGQPQPPELQGVDGDPRSPNRMQPMTGEMVHGKEVGRDGYWPPPPQHPADDGPGRMAPTLPSRPMSGVVRRFPAQSAMTAPVMQRTGGAPFGAPTGATSPETLAALPPLYAPENPLAALPHFADGGVLPPGGTGVVGDATGTVADEEVVHAIPGGGVRVTPVPPAPRTTLPSQIAGLPDDKPTREQLLAGFGPPQYGPPPEETSATGRYQKALGEFEPGGDLAADKAPRPDQYKAHGWRRVLGDIAGVAAGALSFSPGAGMLVHDAITGAPYRRAAEDYDQHRRLALAALPDLQQAAKMEGDQNDLQQNQYNADRAFNEQQWKDQQQVANEQARLQAERDKTAAMYPPQPAGPDLSTPEGRRQYVSQNPDAVRDLAPSQIEQWTLTGHVGAAPRAAHVPTHRGPNEATEQALAAIATAKSPEQAQAMLADNAARWQQGGVDLVQVQHFINARTSSAHHGGKASLTLNIGGRKVNLGGPPATHTSTAMPPAIGDVRTFQGNSYRFDGREWVKQ